jgi:hypothetical protein
MSEPSHDTHGDTISNFLRRIADAEALPVHHIDDYVRAFEGSAWRAVALLHVGGESVVLELTDGTILKISGKRTLDEDMARRPFDCPILARGHWFHIQWFIQPKIVTPVSIEERDCFREQVKKYGYRMCDPYPQNLGRYHGQVCLLDPWAVSKGRGYT